MTFRNPILGGGGSTLLRPAIQSPNYVPGSTGWAIKRDGSAELNNVVIRGGTVVSGLALYYDGPPALGNLVMSLSTNGGVDSFGNTYLGGIVTYSGATFASLDVGNVFFGFTSEGTATAGLVGLSGGDAIFGSAPHSVSNPNAASWTLTDGDQTVTPISSASYPHMIVDAVEWINGAVIACTDNAGVFTPEAWHAPSYNANWSGTTTYGTVSGGLGTLRYRRDAEDNTWLLGTFTAAAGAGSSVFNLPAAYRPKTNYPLPVAFISSGGVAGNAWMYVSSAGNLNINSQLGSAVTAGTVYTVNEKIPLGNAA